MTGQGSPTAGISHTLYREYRRHPFRPYGVPAGIHQILPFLPRFVLVEAIAPACHAGGLNSEDEVIVILTVEDRHQSLLTGEALVDEILYCRR